MKIRHILSAKEFAEIFKNGTKIQGKTVSLYTKRGDNAANMSVGVVVSKKTVPKATKRNYLRRLIYVYFRDPGEVYRRKTNVVVRVTGQVAMAGRKSLSRVIRDELKALTNKAGITG